MAPALIRDLGALNLHIIACEWNRQTPPLGFYSKYVSETYYLDASNYLEALYNLCRATAETSGEKPALLPVGAATLDALAQPETYDRFSTVCGLAIPTADMLTQFNDKRAVGQLAGSLGIPVPKTYTPAAVHNRQVTFPCVVKPICGEKQGLSAAQRYIIARSPEELTRAWTHFYSPDSPPIVQQYLSGGGLGCSVLASEGRILSAICHRRIREYPITGGPSSCCQSFRSELLEGYAAALVAHTDYTGLAMFEFKEDTTGVAHLLEINPRIWGSFPLTRAAHSGISAAWFAAAWNNGNPGRDYQPPAPRYRDCKMQFAASDLCAAAGYFRNGRKKLALGAVADFFNPRVREGIFEFSDPRPGLKYYASILGRRSHGA